MLISLEAYNLLPSRSNYGKAVLDTLLERITTLEFKGNLIVILAGYADQMDYFLANCGNPG